MLRFEPTETRKWDDSTPTSQKLAQICAWTDQYSNLPDKAKQFIETSYYRAAVARFVLSANLSEEAGLEDFDSTQEVLAAAAGDLSSKSARETKQLGSAMQQLAEHYVQQLSEQPQHKLEALMLTADTICRLHSTLMHDLIYNPGQYRLAEACGGSAMGPFFYQKPELIPSLLLTLVDFYNQALNDIAATTDQIPQLYRLAAVLFVQFVTVHPFSDGNGRLARLLGSHVLRAVTPFPVTPYADGTSHTRSVFLNAIMAARPSPSETANANRAFLKLLPPADFTALLIQSGWESWKDCFDTLER